MFPRKSKISPFALFYVDFGALFAGRHISTTERPEPFDSSSPFEPDFQHLEEFVQDMPKLSVLEREAVEMPLTRPELLAEVEGAARGRSPGLDGLPYEFYVAVIPLIGDHLVGELNAMLEEGELTASLRQGPSACYPRWPVPPWPHS